MRVGKYASGTKRDKYSEHLSMRMKNEKEKKCEMDGEESNKNNQLEKQNLTTCNAILFT